MGLLGHFEVDLKADASLLIDEAYGAAAFSEVWDITDGENVHSLGFDENCGKATLFGSADEQNVAARALLHPGKSLHRNFLAIDALARYGGVEDSSEGIFAQDADLENLCARGGPRHEFSEVVEVSGLNLRISRLRSLGRAEWHCKENEETERTSKLPAWRMLGRAQS